VSSFLWISNLCTVCKFDYIRIIFLWSWRTRIPPPFHKLSLSRTFNSAISAFALCIAASDWARIVARAVSANLFTRVSSDTCCVREMEDKWRERGGEIKKKGWRKNLITEREQDNQKSSNNTILQLFFVFISVYFVSFLHPISLYPFSLTEAAKCWISPRASFSAARLTFSTWRINYIQVDM